MDTSNIFKLLSSFYNVFNKAGKKESEDNEIIAEENPKEFKVEQKKFAPINSEMIKTMRSHDEFIRRVNNKNLQNKIPQK